MSEKHALYYSSPEKPKRTEYNNNPQLLKAAQEQYICTFTWNGARTGVYIMLHGSLYSKWVVKNI